MGQWEEDSSGVKKQYYSFGGSTVAMRDSITNAVTYLHSDHLGSVSLATTSGGNIASQQYFDPWGKVKSGGIGQTSLNYTGQRLDGTGLLYYNARYYDPALGKFLSPDNVADGLNRYAYVHNNPIIGTDPTGHREEAGDTDGGGSEEGGGDNETEKEYRNWREKPYEGNASIDDGTRDHIQKRHEYDPNDPDNPQRFPPDWHIDDIIDAGLDIVNDPTIKDGANNTSDDNSRVKTGERDDLWIRVPYKNGPDEKPLISVMPDTDKNKNSTPNPFSIFDLTPLPKTDNSLNIFVPAPKDNGPNIFAPSPNDNSLNIFVPAPKDNGPNIFVPSPYDNPLFK